MSFLYVGICLQLQLLIEGNSEGHLHKAPTDIGKCLDTSLTTLPCNTLSRPGVTNDATDPCLQDYVCLDYRNWGLH